jgi:hypothetical protein
LIGNQVGEPVNRLHYGTNYCRFAKLAGIETSVTPDGDYHHCM